LVRRSKFYAAKRLHTYFLARDAPCGPLVYHEIFEPVDFLTPIGLSYSGIFTEPRFWLRGWAFPLSEPPKFDSNRQNLGAEHGPARMTSMAYSVFPVDFGEILFVTRCEIFFLSVLERYDVVFVQCLRASQKLAVAAICSSSRDIATSLARCASRSLAMVFDGIIRFSTDDFRSGESPPSLSYHAHLRNRGKVERLTNSLTQGVKKHTPMPGTVPCMASAKPLRNNSDSLMQ
jgi:hypothetical protein